MHPSNLTDKFLNTCVRIRKIIRAMVVMDFDRIPFSKVDVVVTQNANNVLFNMSQILLSLANNGVKDALS